MAVTISHSAQLFQERRIPTDRTTRRLPSPRSDMDANPVHQIPFKPPYPTPGVLQAQGGHPPDAGLTQPWPYGEEEITL